MKLERSVLAGRINLHVVTCSTEVCARANRCFKINKFRVDLKTEERNPTCLSLLRQKVTWLQNNAVTSSKTAFKNARETEITSLSRDLSAVVDDCSGSQHSVALNLQLNRLIHVTHLTLPVHLFYCHICLL